MTKGNINGIEALTLNPNYFFKTFLQPAMLDLVPEYSGVYTGMFEDFTVFPKVSLAKGAPLIDVFTNKSVLQRRDRSCNMNWKQIGTSSNRKLYVTELYGATSQCWEQFYDGDFKDFRDTAPQFLNIITERFRRMIWTDLAINSYFGDTTRPDDDVTDTILGNMNWNSYDGIQKKIINYINAGTIPSSQNLAQSGTYLPSGVMTPDQAYNALVAMYESRNDIMFGLDDMDLAFYIDKRWAYYYSQYLIQAGVNTVKAIDYIQDGVPVLNFQGIPIFVNKLWNPVLSHLNKTGGVPTEAHMGILTIRKNFCFGTDQDYGIGPMNDVGFRIWWDETNQQWRTLSGLVAGTELIAPQHTVYSCTQLATYTE